MRRYAQFARLSQGQDPHTGEQLIAHRRSHTYELENGDEVKIMKHRAGWDFTFSFSPAGVLQASGGGGAQGGASSSEAAGAPSASDPNRAVSLFDALTRELGLKLEVKKRPTPVLVIDKVERKPVE